MAPVLPGEAPSEGELGDLRSIHGSSLSDKGTHYPLCRMEVRDIGLRGLEGCACLFQCSQLSVCLGRYWSHARYLTKQRGPQFFRSGYMDLEKHRNDCTKNAKAGAKGRGVRVPQGWEGG